MTAPDRTAHDQAGGSTTPSPVAFGAIYHLFLHGQLTRLRSIGLGALSSVAVLLAILARTDDDPLRTATEVMANFGLGVVLPVCTLWVAAGLIGDIAEDRLLAYLWIKPISVWTIPAAAVAATTTIMLPLVVVPLVAAALVSGDADLVSATVIACALGVVGYAGPFVALSTRFSRALWFGLGYILVWENAIARIADGTARLAIRSYIHSVLERATDVPLDLADRAVWSTYTVPLAASGAGIALGTWILRRRDID